ncbi:DUF5686 and carboxypeptidase regulatory-like domain-containing protein [Hymenobacter lucidus]|uniref:DUF5686 and carboxypeptidase regulatory-like domain-containing protein n=1 Tax=Hymenobacter lucidus TaxID=2880930 RepID=A0ABS8AVV6_9BACT|nr:DUF5686 and carboxypeptidase regulatory-like domain-containing protein [Hymenobacter lucidus]MCB2409427.1 DUF5686 and carboxypeptidase regulatory-like domain-containing protein [Hymenobacter lucidus]
MLRYLLLLTLFLSTTATWAGIIRGKITDPKGEPLAFANVAVRGSSTSTASNDQGNYQLRLEAGKYELVFQYVGFKPRVESVTVAAGDTATVLNMTLTPENYNLGEVLIRATDRDPAYAIVQHAIDWRKYHRAEVAAFTARMYIKSIIRLTDVPGKILGLVKVGPDLKPGVIYLSESLSDMTYRQPGKIQERMISSRVSGSSKGFSFNRASKNFNFYDNLLPSGFSERGFVSPVAQNAMLFYRYELVGTSVQNGITINKIRVTPRHRIDPAFSGFIYIAEDGTWRLHSLDLALDSNSGIEYVDKLRVEILYAPAPGHPQAWIIQSQKVSLSASGLGFKGNGSINAVLSNYRVTPTYPNPPAVAATPPPTNEPAHRETVAEARQQRPQLRGLTRTMRRDAKTRGQEQIPLPEGGIAFEPMAKGQVMLIEKGANERDEAYWNEVRPIPLSEEETKDYRVKDSVEVIHKSKPYQDSMDHIRNKPDLFGVLLGGYTYNNTFRRRFISIDSPSDGIVYNTVEGVVVNLTGTLTQRYEDRRTYSLEPTLRYGFASKQLSPSLRGGYTFRPESFSRIGFSVGRTILDFDPSANYQQTLINTPLINTSYTLFTNRNYAKYYQRDGLELTYRTELVNGLFVNLAAGYADRRELFNQTTEVIRDIPGRAFTPNQPVAAELPQGTGFGRSRSTTLDVGLTWQPGQQYITRPDGKFNLGNSRFPQLLLGFRQSFRGVLGSDVRYSRLEVGARKEFGFGLFGESQLNVKAGTFLGNPDLTFIDFRHFAGNRTILAVSFEQQFQLLDYYRYSTAERYLEGHYSHHFNGFVFNKIPLFRRLKWQEVATVNYLYTPSSGNYAELGVGIEHIFKIVRVDFFTSLQSGQRLDSGVRIGLGF